MNKSFYKNRQFSIICIAFIIIFSSCGIPKYSRNAIYFKDSVTEAEKIIEHNPVAIKAGDRLNINITAINQQAAQTFNIITSGGSSGSSSGSSSGVSTTGYLVDSSGNVQLLQLGSLHVAGFTTAQLKDTLEQQLSSYVKGPLVTVSIINFHVNMMGEVLKPGVINVPDGKMNILQAITESGDITTFGKRNNILVIREANGKREFGRVDISSNHVFESPYFYLQQNDIIYIEPDKAKFLSNDVITARNLRNLGIITSLVSTLLLILSLAKR